MSTSTKRPLSKADFDAHEFRDLFEGCYVKWEIAGSVRRRKAEIGDIEHVVIPTPALWRKLDLITYNEEIGLFDRPGDDVDIVCRKHVYPNGQKRWGDKYRGVDYRGFCHEIFCADEKNFGSVLAIRTGPAEFSEMLVTKLKASGRLRQMDGYVKYVASGEIYAVPTEEDFFKVCGITYTQPEKRR